jgi:hypothetical protein
MRLEFNRTVMGAFQGDLPQTEDSIDAPIRYAGLHRTSLNTVMTDPTPGKPGESQSCGGTSCL